MLRNCSIALLVTCALLGCRNEEEITTYTIPKAEDVQAANHVDVDRSADETESVAIVPMRLIGAILLEGENYWFIKGMGPVAAADEVMESFLELVQSIRFEGDRPVWKTPAGWSEAGKSGMRLATFTVPTSVEPFEISVIPLPKSTRGDATFDEAVLQDVNRWRGQVGLGPVTLENLYNEESRTEEVRKLTINDQTVVLVNLKGEAPQGGGSMPPFAGGGRRPPVAGGGTPPTRPSQPAPQAAGAPKFPLPEGWTKAPNNAFSLFAAEIGSGDESAKVTVSALGGPAGGLEANVNRWRGQVGLPAVDAATLEKDLKDIAIGGKRGQYGEFFGPEDASPRKAILGAILADGNRTWFFKLTGDAETAKNERGRFQTFLNNIEFP